MESIEAIMSSSVAYGPIERASELSQVQSIGNAPDKANPVVIYYIIGAAVVIAAGCYIYYYEMNKRNQVIICSQIAK